MASGADFKFEFVGRNFTDVFFSLPSLMVSFVIKVHINENFAKLAESLYLADRTAREAVETRAQMERRVAQNKKAEQEEKMRAMAAKARWVYLRKMHNKLHIFMVILFSSSMKIRHNRCSRKLLVAEGSSPSVHTQSEGLVQALVWFFQRI